MGGRQRRKERRIILRTTQEERKGLEVRDVMCEENEIRG
jgi:hypothetical protein